VTSTTRVWPTLSALVAGPEDDPVAGTIDDGKDLRCAEVLCFDNIDLAPGVVVTF